MTNEKFNEIVDKVITVINDGVVLMTEKEEYDYKKRVIDNLKIWLKEFPFKEITNV